MVDIKEGRTTADVAADLASGTRPASAPSAPGNPDEVLLVKQQLPHVLAGRTWPEPERAGRSHRGRDRRSGQPPHAARLPARRAAGRASTCSSPSTAAHAGGGLELPRRRATGVRLDGRPRRARQLLRVDRRRRRDQRRAELARPRLGLPSGNRRTSRRCSPGMRLTIRTSSPLGEPPLLAPSAAPSARPARRCSQPPALCAPASTTGCSRRGRAPVLGCEAAHRARRRAVRAHHGRSSVAQTRSWRRRSKTHNNKILWVRARRFPRQVTDLLDRRAAHGRTRRVGKPGEPRRRRRARARRSSTCPRPAAGGSTLHVGGPLRQPRRALRAATVRPLLSRSRMWG